jgi:hypothetical protein
MKVHAANLAAGADRRVGAVLLVVGHPGGAGRRACVDRAGRAAGRGRAAVSVHVVLECIRWRVLTGGMTRDAFADSPRAARATQNR